MLISLDQNHGHPPQLGHLAREAKNENHRNNEQIIKREFEIRLAVERRDFNDMIRFIKMPFFHFHEEQCFYLGGNKHYICYTYTLFSNGLSR